MRGGGVSAETPAPGASPQATDFLTTDDAAPLVVLRAGRSARQACERVVRSGLAADAFELKRLVLRREAGAWVVRTEAVWPGYVLAEPAAGVSAEDLGATGSLTPAESALVRRLGGASHVISLSQGRIENGALNVLFGPLMGLEGLVRRIDRHRRTAWLEPEPGRRIPVGLEVTSKS